MIKDIILEFEEHRLPFMIWVSLIPSVGVLIEERLTSPEQEGSLIGDGFKLEL